MNEINKQMPFLNTPNPVDMYAQKITEPGGKKTVNLITFALSRKTCLKFKCQLYKQCFCDIKIQIFHDVKGIR